MVVGMNMQEIPDKYKLTVEQITNVYKNEHGHFKRNTTCDSDEAIPAQKQQRQQKINK